MAAGYQICVNRYAERDRPIYSSLYESHGLLLPRRGILHLLDTSLKSLERKSASMKGLAEQVAALNVPHRVESRIAYSLRNRDASCHRAHEKWVEGLDVWLTLEGRLNGRVRDHMKALLRAGLHGF